MVKTVVSIHRRGPFSAIVQSESMSYSSIVDRQRENADGSWFGVQKPATTRGARERTNDQRDFFIFDRTRLYLFARILTGRSLPRDRHACRHATPPAPFLRLGVRLAPARGIHGAASGGVVAAPSLASGLARPYSERFLRLNKHL